MIQLRAALVVAGREIRGSLRSQGKLRQLFWGQDERYIIRSRKHNEPETTNRLPEESHAQRLVGGDYFLAEYGILPHVHQRGDNFLALRA